MRHTAWLLTLAIAIPAVSRAQPTVAADDYARAESFLSGNTNGLVSGMVSGATWLDDDRIGYRVSIPDGSEFVLASAGDGTRARAFDHERMAEALSRTASTTYEPFDLPQASWSDAGAAISFVVSGTPYRCVIETYDCAAVDDESRERARNAIVSPDGRRAAFIRDHNLWVHDMESGRETRVTTDGVEHFGYATNNAGWTRSDRPVLLWSPDSRKIATFQHDGREVGEMYLATTNVGHPTLEAWKYPLVGDEHIFMLHRVVIHLDEAGPRVVRLTMDPDPHRSTISDHVAAGDGSWLDVEWSDDSTRLAFVSSSRDHKSATLRIADPETGEVRTVMNETVDTFFESGDGKVNWHALPESNEAIWFSEQSDWGHLYLHDLETGTLKHPITSGDWNVLQLLRIDKTNRTLYFTGAGREPGDPYYQYLYRIRMDGTGLELLTPETAQHTIMLAPDGTHFLDSYSTSETPPVSVIRDASGTKIATLEQADISRLVAMGWRPPTPFNVRARDGVTELYGLMYTPTNLDESGSYPVLNYLYPGPQSGSVGSRAFRPSRDDKQSLAELGFVVVELDAMGTPGRSKSFHEAYYGDMGDNGLPDQIAGIKELASRHPWMDLERVGIWGHSGGGFASTAGILRYPEFYKVAVAGAGNHDNRNYEDDWGEKWQGLLMESDDTTNYDSQANQLIADRLQGKLLLGHGTMDTNVPFYNTLLVVNALIAANKDFDLVLLPNRSHGFGREAYWMRRRWDYFVRYLLGTEPPAGYEITTSASR